MHSRATAILCILVIGSTGLALAADPPEAIYYQGVLRDSNDNPRNGVFTMVFRLFDDPDFGVPLLCDSQSVDVTNGLFGVTIGEEANIEACMGPDDTVTLTSVLSSHEPLYLQIAVDGEMLWPRVPLASSPYALNARRVRGTEIVATGPIDLYVDAVGGDDANDGSSLEKAKATIQAAVNAIPDRLAGNAVVHIQPGTYHEQVWVAPRNGTAVSQVMLIGAGATPSDVILDGTGVDEFPGIGIMVMMPGTVIENMTISNWDTETAVNVFGGGDLIMNNCRIVENLADAPGEDPYAGLVVDGASVEITDCEFSNNETAILATRGGHVRIFDEQGSSFSGNVWGIVAERGSSVFFNSGSGSQNCTMTSSPMKAWYHSTIARYATNCNPDGSSTCDNMVGYGQCEP